MDTETESLLNVEQSKKQHRGIISRAETSDNVIEETSQTRMESGHSPFSYGSINGVKKSTREKYPKNNLGHFFNAFILNFVGSTSAK